VIDLIYFLSGGSRPEYNTTAEKNKQRDSSFEMQNQGYKHQPLFAPASGQQQGVSLVLIEFFQKKIIALPCMC